MLCILHIGSPRVTLAGDVNVAFATCMEEGRRRVAAGGVDLIVVDDEIAAAAIRDCGVPVVTASIGRPRRMAGSAFENLKPFIRCAEAVSQRSTPPFAAAV